MAVKKLTLAPCCLTTVIALALAAPAVAAPATTAVSSYLRAAPSFASAVLDEVEHDRVVDVLGEAGGWKRVRWGGREGFIDAAAFAPLATPAGGPACVKARWADDTGRPVTRLCGPAPAKVASGR